MRVCLFTCAVVILASNAYSAIYLIEPDGSGDFSTIQEALDNSSNFDIVELADGIFTGHGNRDLVMPFRRVTLRSQTNDPTACIIACQGDLLDHHRGITVQDGSNFGGGPTLRGFTISGAYTLNHGSALLIESESGDGTGVTVENCVFTDNGGVSNVAAVYIATGYRPVTFIDCIISESGNLGLLTLNYDELTLNSCLIENNENHGLVRSSPHDSFPLTVTDSDFRNNGGDGIFTGYGGDIIITSCEFTDNSGHGLYLETSGYAVIEIRDSLSANNGELGVGVHRGRLSLLASSTIAANGSHGVWLYDQNSVENCYIENTTVAFNGSVSIYVPSSSGGVELSCSDLYGNTFGDWTDMLAWQYGINGNFSEDPLFCEPESGDFSLSTTSPCAPDNSPAGCGLIGAVSVGCEDLTGVTSNDRAWPTQFALAGNFPNPFNPMTTIRYELTEPSRVTLCIYDLSGGLVRTLRQGAVESAGYREAEWNGRDDSGRPVASGTYYYRLSAGDYVETRRMTMVR